MTEPLAATWLDAGAWYRLGRGRSFEFELPTTLVVQVIDQTVTRLDDRVDLLTCEVERIDGQYFSTFRLGSIDELAPDGPWLHFLRSQRLTPAIPAPYPVPNAGSNWPSTFAANGLIALWHPDPSGSAGPKGRERMNNEPNATPRSSLGIVQRVGNRSTEQVVEHLQYDKLFGSLRRAIQAEVARCAT